MFTTETRGTQRSDEELSLVSFLLRDLRGSYENKSLREKAEEGTADERGWTQMKKRGIAVVFSVLPSVSKFLILPRVQPT